MPELTVPQTPPLARLANVELIQTGTWNVSTGTWTVTTDDLADAVAALECPSVRRPVLKLGHTDPRFDGEPCVGYVDHLAVADAGRTLVGDYAGMPGWLGDVLASAYPDRSVEGEYDYRCQMGHVHPFVLHAVALLGVTAPGIGTLESLQDVAALYGVIAKSGHSGTPVSVPVKGSSFVPGLPYTHQVAASVTAEDVMRAFYGSELGSGWDAWVEELQLEPLQLIYVNDVDNARSRVPVTIGTGEGVDAVTFGDPVPVIVRYVDAAAALPARNVVKFAYRAKADRIAATAPPSQEGSPMDITDDQLAAMRSALDLEGDADVTAVIAALQARQIDPASDPSSAQPAAPPSPAPSALPDGTVAIDQAQLNELIAAAKAGAEARAQQQREAREAQVRAAIADGRIAPARRDAWIKQLEADPGSADVLASLAPGLIPVGSEIGHAGSATSTEDDLYARLFGQPVTPDGKTT